MIRFIIMSLLSLIFSGCLPPNGDEHQKGVDYANSVEGSLNVKREIEAQGAKINAVYVVVTTSIFANPVIHLDIYLTKPLKNYDSLFQEIEKEKQKLNLKEKAKVTLYEGDLKVKKELSRKVFN